MGEYRLRRDNLISPWGVGSIAPFPHDESLMIGGLDNWFDGCTNMSEFEIHDPRLSEQMNWKKFYCPPDYRERSKENNEICIPAVRFPLWNYCPICGNMDKLTPGSDRKKCKGDMRRKGSNQSYCNKNAGSSKKLRYLIPERFVAVCEAGHIEDFPVAEWIHQGDYVYQPGSCKINRSTGGGSSSLAGIRYTCTCGASRNMVGAFSRGALDRIGYTCKGNRPWLPEGDNSCGKSLLVIQRGASNVWFPEVFSSIYIPSDYDILDSDTKDLINMVIEKCGSHRTDGEVDVDTIKRKISGLNDAFYDNKCDEKTVLEKVLQRLSGNTQSDDSEDSYRYEEYKVLIQNSGTPEDPLFVKNIAGKDYSKFDFIKSVSLVYKLKETRVFKGFRRLKIDGEVVDELSARPLDWLPAIQNSGEGILIQLDYDLLQDWASNEKVKQRIRKIDKSTDPKERLDPVFVLLHTFSHCLITALANDSGYSSASIRERVYCCQNKNEEYKMAGILIYTASGDSEGSLGGLVRQGVPERLNSIIFRAINDATWCASDPVCIQSEGQGQDGCNLAACHNCALLPETSCEHRNKMLDRGVMIGTLDEPEIGFFAQYLS